MKDTQDTKSREKSDIDKIASVTPFESKQLEGQKFAKGNMLGGAAPVVETDTTAPWEK